MKLYFEQYPYPLEKVSANVEKLLLSVSKDGRTAMITYVGYYFSPEINDTIFILPKVFIKKFGFPEDIIDVSLEENSSLEKEDKEIIFSLSTWLYQAIQHYVERNPENGITSQANIQNVIASNGESDKTYLDVILALLKFHKEHKNLFTQIAIINNSGNNKIHWGKTIRKTQPIFKNSSPYYTEFRNKNRVVNFDDEIIVLFYSVLQYVRQNYHFQASKPVGYETMSPQKIESIIESEKGTRILRSMRGKYYTDELKALWELLYAFFDKAEQIHQRHYSSETLLVHNFNIVFEDMIDQLISDTDIPKGLKEQKDGKIIDHIYSSRSLIDDSDIYFIGDSKYYKEENEVGDHSIYKQFTYAKNVIQYNIDIFNEKGSHKKEELRNLRYRDELTEGYNITPNFFIRGVIDDNKDYSYSDARLKKEQKEPYINEHFQNRLFDRDTLVLQSYNINFLYVLSSYISEVSSSESEYIKKTFRKDLLATFDSHYNFYKITPQGIDVKTFVNKYFRLLSGKIYQSNENDTFIWLALEKMKSDQINNNDDVLTKIAGDSEKEEVFLSKEEQTIPPPL